MTIYIPGYGEVNQSTGALVKSAPTGEKTASPYGPVGGTAKPTPTQIDDTNKKNAADAAARSAVPVKKDVPVAVPTYEPRGTAGGIPGMTNLQTDAFRAVAKTALQQLGVLDYQPTNDELRSFFAQGFDAEGIANYYATDPTFVARNPGVPYGLSRDTYNDRVKQYGTQWSNSFGGQGMPTAPGPGATKAEREGNLIGYALKSNIDPNTFGQTVEKYRQTTGKAPTQADYASFTAQQAQATRQPTAAAYGRAPKAPQQQQEKRAAVGRGGK